ncbi:hypothetical protein EV363DRAFT_528376 [Boletus edulis]|nr:hypothetical protein EV363DRAFT_528376 [Boletus edulis]
MDFPPASEAQIAFSPAHLHIDILESHQRKGWGKRLIGTAIRHLKEKGLKAVWLGMDPRNKAAALFYERLGFHMFDGAPQAVLGITVEEWENKWENGKPLGRRRVNVRSCNYQQLALVQRLSTTASVFWLTNDHGT